MERIKWKLYLRWQYTKYRIKTRRLKIRIWFVKAKTTFLKMFLKEEP